jgi:hypothetical protein
MRGCRRDFGVVAIIAAPSIATKPTSSVPDTGGGMVPAIPLVIEVMSHAALNIGAIRCDIELEDPPHATVWQRGMATTTSATISIAVSRSLRIFRPAITGFPLQDNETPKPTAEMMSAPSHIDNP